VVEAAREEGVESVLAGVPAGPVPAVVTQGDRLGQSHVEPAGPGDRGGHLRHLEGVGETRPLVVQREDEHLGLTGQTPERGSVEDPVPVPLEAGAPRVRFLGPGPLSTTDGARRPRSEEPLLPLLAGLPVQGTPGGTAVGTVGTVIGAVIGATGSVGAVDPGARVGVSQSHRSRIPRHRRGPTDVAVRFPGLGDLAHVMQSALRL